MKTRLGLLAVLMVMGLFPGIAKADPIVLTTILSGTNEVPPAASSGTGNAVVTVDPVTHMLTVSVTFSGLVGPTTASHIHCCAPAGTNAMVATAVPTFPGFPLGVLAGSYSQTFDLTLASTYNPAFITAHGGTVGMAEQDLINGLLSGQAYLNVHSQTFPGGEIRGQLEVVPEPATLLLLGIGLGGVALRVRRARNGP